MQSLSQSSLTQLHSPKARLDRCSWLWQRIRLLSLVGLLGSTATLAQATEVEVESALSEPMPVAPEMVTSTESSSAGAHLKGQEVYIDPTSYEVGATERYVASPEVITPHQYAEVPQFSGNAVRATGWDGAVSGDSIYPPGQTSSSGWAYTANTRRYPTYRPPGRMGNGNLRLLFPLSIPAPITSLFGWRIHPITGESRFHSGVDLGAPLGTPVLAALAGRVAIADWLGGYGLTVTLEHGDGKQETLYAHLSEIFVKPGEVVQQGEAIGLVGSTGLSTGPHLHFEFRQLTDEGWVALDPGAQLEYGLAQLIQAMQTAKR